MDVDTSLNSVLWTGQGFTDVRDQWDSYRWIVVMGALTAFASKAWSIGANDVANAFGTTVGAKTITLWQACIIAAIFEFVGAVALGGQVAKTVAGSITSLNYFISQPEVFALGMLCALISAWAWVTIATYCELAVSTTHSIIGAIMGWGLVYGGRGTIVWDQSQDAFPYHTGLVPIVISWFTSPCIAAGFAAILFLINRHAVLRRQNSTVLACIALPILVLLTVFIGLFFVLYKGAKAELAWDDSKAAWVSIAAAGGASALTIPLAIWLKRRADSLDANGQPPEVKVEKEEGKPGKEGVEEGAAPADEESGNAVMKVLNKAKKHMIYSLTVDVHEDVQKDERVSEMHAAAEVFNPHTEYVYKYLQVFSACCVSFSHGANDVANAVGPFAGIWYVYNNYAVSGSVPCPKWILVIGGAGIVTGLATYGYNIIKVLGVKMAKMTPSRGYCAELSTALTVALASIYGLPISTTHCIVGAEVGVGLVEGLMHGTNWLLFAKTFLFWVLTLVFAGFISAAVFAFSVFSPCLIELNDLQHYRDWIQESIQNQTAVLNQTNYANNRTLGVFYKGLDTSLKALNGNLTTVMGGAKKATDPGMVKTLFSASNAMYMSLTTPTVGFNKAGRTNSTSSIIVPSY